MALVFISIFGSLLWCFLLGFGITFAGLVPSNFLGAQVSGYCYACAVTCGQSFTVLSVWGVLISVLECFSVFSHPPLPFIIITLSLLSLLLLLLLVITVIIISTELLALCDGCLGCGWVWRAGLVAGLQVRQAFGVLLLPGFGVSSSTPRFLGTQPPYAVQALKRVKS